MQNGFLVQPRSTESLIEAVRKFLSLSNTDRDAMGKFSRKLAEEIFDIREVIKVYKKITGGSI